MKENKVEPAPTPEQVPIESMSDLSRKFINWKYGMVLVLGIFLVFTFLNTFATNPTVSGYAVADPNVDSARFTGSTSVLVVVFAFFALFLIILSKKMSDK